MPDGLQLLLPHSAVGRRETHASGTEIEFLCLFDRIPAATRLFGKGGFLLTNELNENVLHTVLQSLVQQRLEGYCCVLYLRFPCTQ